MKFILIFSVSLLLLASSVYAQELYNDVQHIWRAQVVAVISETEELVEGTETKNKVQVLKVALKEGERAGESVTFRNDYIQLKKGDNFFLSHIITMDGDEYYAVRDIDRRYVLTGLFFLFIMAVVIFARGQGIRSLLSLVGSLLVIIYILLPGVLAGFSPIWLSAGVAATILFFAIFFTHGFNWESLAAFLGTISAVLVTTLLALASVKLASLTGFSSNESVYLNLNTAGRLDFQGLLLGAIIIGVLGVLDDIAITQATVVRELYGSNPNLSHREVYTRAIAVGREHVGALVNTLALAYTGASLPLLLLFSSSAASFSFIINQEVFATEIIRTMVGSIGLVLTVPLSTFLAVALLSRYKGRALPDGAHGGHRH